MQPLTSWKFWRHWVLGNALGWAVGWPLLWPAFEIAAPVADSLLWLGVGAFGGWAQWLVLRGKIIRAGRWILVTALGLPIGIGASRLLSNSLVKVIEGLSTSDNIGILARVGLELAVLAITIGTAVGLAQWPVLRLSVPRAYWWVIVNALAGLISGMVTFLVPGLFSELPVWEILPEAISGGVEKLPALVGGAGVGAVGGTLFGAMTGIVLLQLSPRMG